LHLHSAVRYGAVRNSYQRGSVDRSVRAYDDDDDDDDDAVFLFLFYFCNSLI
jgi:hypothetical protein